MLEFAGINIPFNRLKGVSLGNPGPEWPIYQASGYGEVFMYDNLSRLRWLPNAETFEAYGYEFGQQKIVPISWFYDKPIVESIVDTKTGRTYPAESTPNYKAYRTPVALPPEEKPPAPLPPTPIPLLYKCPICGKTFSSIIERTKHIASTHAPTPPITRQVACSQCKSTLEIIPPSPGTMVTQAFTWLTCPVCGYPKLVQVPTGGFRVEIVSKQPWPPTPIPRPGAPTIRQQECARCGSLLEITSQALAPEYQKEVICPVCGYNFGFKAVDFKILEREPWPPVAKFAPIIPPEGELPMPIMAPITSILDVMKFITTPPEIIGAKPPIALPPTEEVIPPGVQQIKDALNQYEKIIEELENALRTAQAAEFYNNPYGTIAAQAVKILGQLEQIRIPSPPVTMIYPVLELPAWCRDLTNHLNNLKNRLKTLIVNCRTAAKEIKPIPTYSEEVGKQQDEWITGTTSLLQQRGLPWGSLPFSYLQPGQTAINGRAILPAEGGIPPSWETYTEFPVGIPDYSVEQRIQEASGQEPWELAEAVAPAPPKKITPYLILGGLAVTTLGVWYYKKKKKKA